jgi:hypothetical protein
MSQPGIIYQGQFLDMSGAVTTTVKIFDQSVQIPDGDTPVVIDLKMIGITIQVINNSRDKFDPIRAKQAIIRFRSSKPDFLNSDTFADAPDNNFSVLIYSTDPAEPIFIGFLMLTDMEEAFQPDPNVVVLTASDHLGLLDDVPLTALDESVPSGKVRIADALAMALNGTGMQLPIKVINNLRHGSGSRSMLAQFAASTDSIIVSETDFFYTGGSFLVSGSASNNILIHAADVGLLIVTIVVTRESLVDEGPVSVTFTDVSSGHLYDKVYIDIGATAEEEINTRISSRDVIARILGEDCFITQWKGAWYIMRVDEFDNNQIYVANFDADGTFTSMDAGTAIDMSIGAAEDRKFCNADALKLQDRPHKSVQEKFSYDYPLEIIANPEFERGALTTDVSPQQKWYAIDNWGSFQSDFGASGGLSAASTDIYTRRDFIEGVESARYVVIELNGTPSNLIISKPVEMYTKDKFNLTVSKRMSANVGSPGAVTETAAQVRLYGNDGTYWTLRGTTTVQPLPLWEPCTEDFNTDQQLIQYQYDAGQDLRDSVSATVEAPALPVIGYIRVLLYQSSEFGDIADTYIEPPSFDYIPFINGTYEKYTSQQNTIDRGGTDYNARRRQQVYISDSPRPVFKGSLYIPSKISRLLVSGSITFGTNGFVASGDQRAKYLEGMHVFVDAATNPGYYTVLSATYNIIGNTTAVVVNSSLTAVTETASIYAAAFYLTRHFYSAAPLALGSPPDDTYFHTYGWHQAYAVWNQYIRAYRVFTGSVLGIGTDWPDLIYKFSLTDTDPNTVDRYFMLLSYSQDHKTGMWTATVAEVFRTDIGKIYTDPLTFRYLSGSDPDE